MPAKFALPRAWNSVGRFLSLISILIVLLGAARDAEAQDFRYAVGADVSFLKQAEDRGTVFRDDGKPEPALQILRDHGFNWVRLRLFVNPTGLPNNLSYTIASAQKAKSLGFKFLLDLHYSDTWADPGKQYTPKAWAAMSHAQLVTEVYDYTRDTIRALRAGGVLPDMVQIGNEITNGMLWPDGKLPQNWDQFADLIKAGINGVDAGHGNQPRPLIMIHIDRGGDWPRTHDFFDHLLARGVRFDVIGQSYYPWWQGSLNDLRENLYRMAVTYHKDIILAEVAYPWKAAAHQRGPGPFAETPEGQKQFLQAVNRVVEETPDNLGKGLFWWEPSVPAGTPLRIRGIFDDNGNALPAVTAFDEFTRR
ncbi:MAG: glycoside hydrolase family 53 protein [Terriglobia bacterium]